MSGRDETLVAEAQQGNMKAFAALVDRHKGRVYRTLYQVVGDEQDAQDLTQEVFLKVFRSLAGYRGDAAFTTWLHRLTLNLSFDWLRARKRRPLQVPLEPTREDGSLVRELPSSEEGPEESAVRKERRDELFRAIQSLSPDYREAIVLYHFQNLSYREIAQRLGVPVRTVETRLYRARAMLRSNLAKKEGGNGGGVQRHSRTTQSVLGP